MVLLHVHATDVQRVELVRRPTGVSGLGRLPRVHSENGQPGEPYVASGIWKQYGMAKRGSPGLDAGIIVTLGCVRAAAQVREAAREAAYVCRWPEFLGMETVITNEVPYCLHAPTHLGAELGCRTPAC